jgi:putative endonuclease
MNLGRQGEQAVAEWIQEHKWTLLAQNARIGPGEIDLIALDPQGALVFIEVKTDREPGFVLPAMRIDAPKQRQIWRCAQAWLQQNPQIHFSNARFDAFSVWIEPQIQIHWHPSAFSPFFN